MHPRNGVFGRHFPSYQLLGGSLEGVEPRPDLTTLDVGDLLAKRLNETLLKSDFLSFLRSKLAFLNLSIAGQKLALVGGGILSGFEQRLPHRRVCDTLEHIVPNLMDGSITSGHQRIDPHDAVTCIWIGQPHAADLG